MLTALEPSLELDRKHVLRLLRLYGYQDLSKLTRRPRGGSHIQISIQFRLMSRAE